MCSSIEIGHKIDATINSFIICTNLTITTSILHQIMKFVIYTQVDAK